MILWDVDTQVDFMLPHGKLYVPGAEETVPVMRMLVDAARAAGVVHVAEIDDHELTDPEISEEPDYSTTYPPHCLRGTRGALKIPETEQEDPVPVTLELLPERYLSGHEFLLLKKTVDVFTNPNTDRLLEHLDPDEIVVFGVATTSATTRGLDEARVRSCTSDLARSRRRVHSRRPGDFPPPRLTSGRL